MSIIGALDISIKESRSSREDHFCGLSIKVFILHDHICSCDIHSKLGRNETIIQKGKHTGKNFQHVKRITDYRILLQSFSIVQLATEVQEDLQKDGLKLEQA